MLISSELEARLEPIVSRFSAEKMGDLVDLLVLVANADGAIDQAERVALRAGVETIVGAVLQRRLVSELVDQSLTKISRDGINTRAAAVGEALGRADRAEDGLRAGIAVALASQGVGEPERRLLTLIAQSGGVSTARLEVLVEEALPVED